MERFAVAKRTVSRQMAPGENILIPISSDMQELEHLYSVNDTAANVLRFLEGRAEAGATLEECVRHLLDTYETGDLRAEDVTRDVAELFVCLEEEGIVIRSRADAEP